MNLVRPLLLLLLLYDSAGAQVSFQAVDAGLTPMIEAWKARLGSTGGGVWLWGATAIDYDGDRDSDVLLMCHNAAPPGVPTAIICRNDFVPSGMLSFIDVTATVLPDTRTLPSENKPHVWDLDNDGDWDLLSGGVGATQINTGGVFRSNGQAISGRERSAVLGDFNADGLKDFYKIEKLYSRSTRLTQLCGPNGVFKTVITPLFADDLPRAGILAARTDYTGTLNMGGYPGLVVGMPVDVSWTGGQRTGMKVTAISRMVTVEGGSGDALPAVSTTVEVRPQPDTFYLALPKTVRDRYAESVARNDPKKQYNRTKGPDFVSQDVNNDGLVDLLIWFEGSYVGDFWSYLCLRQPDGSLIEASTSSGLPIDGCRPLSAIDVNGDRLADLLIAPGGLANAGLWIQSPDGKFTNAANRSIADKLKTGTPYMPHEWWEDFDQDGDPDLAIAMLRGGLGHVWSNNGDGTFTIVIDGATIWDADGMQVRSRGGYACDFNADGLIDVLTVGSPIPASAGPAICWLNTSNPPRGPRPPSAPQGKLNP